MTPQYSFMVVAPILPGREQDLRELLLSMNRSGGDADPANGLFPFGSFPRIHFARFVILDDRTSTDLGAYGLPVPAYPAALAFLGDFDGPSPTIVPEFVREASDGLTRIFLHCDASLNKERLPTWMESHAVKPSATYINQLGRTVRSVREESTLYEALQKHVGGQHDLKHWTAQALFQDSKRVVTEKIRDGSLTLTSEETTPWGWRFENFIHLIGVPFVLLLLSPLLLLYAPFFLFQLWRRERSDPEIAPRIELDHADALARIEDHDVTNQFSAFGSIKPGLFRRWTLVFILWVIQYTARHLYHSGRLARVSTIHFARWAFLDDRKRLFFASNYDGSLEAYMDDFINKVAFGLNAVFSNGIGYPSTKWLISKGAKDEQKFKYYIRRHQVPTEVWYNAHAGLTAFAMQRNTRVRQGLEKESMTEVEAAAWLGLL
ncbi:MAG: hypothetical protein JWM43_4080 [Acidobacteriaceae bacterium]|nr:hypothetical protein [Acidobacteriaceae bacterium]